MGILAHLSLVTNELATLFFFLIYLAVPGLSCNTQELQLSLRHVESLPVAPELLVVVGGI